MRTKNASYLNLLFDRARLTKWMRQLKTTIKWYEKANNTTIDAFAVCGVSGIAVGSIVAHYCGKRLLVVRKHDDKSTHSINYVEGMETSGNTNNYLFFDDLIEEGTTLAYATAMIEHQWRELVRADSYFDDTTMTKQPKMIGVALYFDVPTLTSKSEVCNFQWQDFYAMRIRDGLIRWHSRLFWDIKDLSHERQIEYCRELVPTKYTLLV